MIMQEYLKQRISLAAVFAVLAFSPNASGEEMNGNATDPAERQRALLTKLESLKAEQDLLRFQKTLSEADSKYLILEPSAGKGALMYRNRVLRTFKMEKVSRKTKAPAWGIMKMTEKIDGAPKKRALIFGSNLVFRGKRADIVRTNQTAYLLGSKDLAALYYALEVGSKVYVKWDE